MSILEGLDTSKDIVHFFAFQEHLVLVLGFDTVDVGAGPAKEAEVVHGLLCEQDVRTGWAEKHAKSWCRSRGSQPLVLFSILQIIFYFHY